MNYATSRILAGLTWVFLTLASPAFAERSVIRVEDGITVEEEPEVGRTLPILFGTTTMSVDPQRIAAWINAVHTFVDWQHNCEEARVIPQPDGSRLTYNRIGSPWPVSDRDMVIRSKRTDLDGGAIRIEFQSTDDSGVPVPSGVVRMARLIGSYDLTPTEGGTKVVYTIDSDPGGSLPDWLVRRTGKDLPYFTLSNLREQAEKGPPPPR